LFFKGSFLSVLFVSVNNYVRESRGCAPFPAAVADLVAAGGRGVDLRTDLLGGSVPAPCFLQELVLLEGQLMG